MTHTFNCGCQYAVTASEVRRQLCATHENAMLFERTLRRIAAYEPNLIDRDTRRALNECRKEEPHGPRI